MMVQKLFLCPRSTSILLILQFPCDGPINGMAPMDT